MIKQHYLVTKSSRNNGINNIKFGYEKKGTHLDICNILNVNEFEAQF
jgi:hypothetical protein